MVESAAVPGPADRRGLALVGLTGALLTGIGDVLILGRPCSGSEFDQAAGIVPPHIDADNKWRSLWNGAALPVPRIYVGTLAGYVGIGLLQRLAMLGISKPSTPDASAGWPPLRLPRSRYRGSSPTSAVQR